MSTISPSEASVNETDVVSHVSSKEEPEDHDVVRVEDIPVRSVFSFWNVNERPSITEPSFNISSKSEKDAEAAVANILKNQYIDPYSDDEVTLRFLRSKPTCFIVLGKEGVGRTTLATRLSLMWGCILISPTAVLENVLEGNDDQAEQLRTALLNGKSIPNKTITDLMLQRLKSPEVVHHGYVLDGLPSRSIEHLSLNEQLAAINDSDLQPDFIVNLRIPDADLEVRRWGQKVDPYSNEVFIKAMYDPEKLPVQQVEPTEEEIEEEQEEEEAEDESEPVLDANADEKFIELPSEVTERLVRRPEDMPEAVKQSIDNYKDNVLQFVEDYIESVDSQQLIELDANHHPNALFKQVMAKLTAVGAKPAAVVNRLVDAAEDEEEGPDIPDNLEGDELLRNLASRSTVGTRWRWRRSRWGTYCPVELYKGNLVVGKAQFAVSFLDKIYVLSSQEAFDEFTANPRKFLKPPQPREPAKFAIIGQKLAGKSIMANLLGQRYGAKVIDTDVLFEPCYKEAFDEHMEKVRKEATETAIHAVTQKLAEQRELEKAERQRAAEIAKRLADELNEHTDTDTAEEDASGKDGRTSRIRLRTQRVTQKPKKKASILSRNERNLKRTKLLNIKRKGKRGLKLTDSELGLDWVHWSERYPRKSVTLHDGGEEAEEEPSDEREEEPDDPLPDPVIEVDETHPQVIEMVEKALKHAASQRVHVAPEKYVELAAQHIKDLEEQRALNNPNGTIYGGWILDNFPRTKEEMAVMAEHGLIPDEVICLHDTSDNMEFLMEKWYLANKDDVDSCRELRLKKEEEERQRLIEEEKARLAEEKRIMEETARQERLLDRQRRIDAGEDVSDEEEETGESQQGDETDAAGPETYANFQPEEPLSREVTSKFPVGPETQEQLDAYLAWEKEWSNFSGVITDFVKPPIVLAVNEKTADENCEECSTLIDEKLLYHAWEYSTYDQEEDDEDADAVGEEEMMREEENEEEEEEDPARSKNKFLGDSNYYCPVMLKEKSVLWPGNPEIAGKYREKTYYFANEEARDRFLIDPATFLPVDLPPKIPPIRIIVLGPKGAGKTLHTLPLAKKLGLFHISFPDRLQELVLPKLRRRIGPEYLEGMEDEDDKELAQEEKRVAALFGPDGEPISTALADEEQLTSEKSDVSTRADTTKEGSRSHLRTDAEKKYEGEEEPEEEEPELTEDEENIKSHLENPETDPLPPETLENIVCDWWFKEPFKSTGFILEGFPRTETEVDWMADHGLYPDCVLVFNVEDTDVIARLLPGRMDIWQAKRKAKLELRQKIRDMKKKHREFMMDKRRKVLLHEREERRTKKKLDRDFERAERARAAEEEEAEEEEEEEAEEEVEEEEEEDDIEAILAEEFEEDEEDDEEEDDETEEDANDRISSELSEWYENDVSNIDGVGEGLERIMVPKWEIEANRKQHIVKYLLNKKIRPYIENRQSIFERVYAISEGLSERMTKTGYKQLSHFGRWCPVGLSEGDVIQPMHGIGYKAYPAVYRSYVYYFKSAEAREMFVKNPIKYVNGPSPMPVVPMNFALVGPPKSGKSALADRFVSEFGVLKLSLGSAIRTCLEKQPNTQLAREIKSHLWKGLTVPEELSIQALQVAMMTAQCNTRGVILDGLPVSRAQIYLMTAKKIIPHRVVELEVSSEEVMVRATKDRNNANRMMVLHDSPQSMVVKLSEYRNNIDKIREWYTSQHMNWVKITGEASKWWLWISALDVVNDSVGIIQNYLTRINRGTSAPLRGLCVTYDEFKKKLSDFGQYCPVSLAKGELVDCSVSEFSLQYAAEYQGFYFKCAGESELAEFLTNPSLYVPPLAPNQLPNPDMLPKRITQAMAKNNMHWPVQMQGYCPVTFVEGKKRYEALIPGNNELVVLYREKLYYFCSNSELEAFMRTPEKFWNIPLPHKLPPPKMPMDLQSLPMLGYMEQTVSRSLIKALTAVGSFKPKFPFISSSESALLYVALHLKAYNPKSSDWLRRKYKRKLIEFEEKCELIQYLSNNMTINYKRPELRPVGFDKKLSTFAALGKNDTVNVT